LTGESQPIDVTPVLEVAEKPARTAEDSLGTILPATTVVTPADLTTTELEARKAAYLAELHARNGGGNGSGG
jgi:hypothetical protein